MIFTKRTPLVLACLCAVSLAATAADEKTKADNTSMNQRDRSGETQTSGDQSNSSADLKITQAIRQALMKDSELSMTAKNVKIITNNSTLKDQINRTTSHKLGKQLHTNERANC